MNRVRFIVGYIVAGIYMFVTVIGNDTEEEHSCWHCRPEAKDWMGTDSKQACQSESNRADQDGGRAGRVPAR